MEAMRARITDYSSRLAAAAWAPAVAALLLAGCSSTANPPGPGTPTQTSPTVSPSPGAAPPTGTTASPSPTASVQIGNTLNYGSMGTTATLDCANGKSLNVAGSNNTLTVTGTCATVTVGGTDNKIVFDKVDSRLTVLGVNNTITYKDGDPRVDNVGTGNTVKKAS